jgi:serine/threonine protein phosphatase PrpC
MESFGQTDRGKVRKSNQDNILLNRDLRLFIVADGMGGHACGEVASELACRTVNGHLQTRLAVGADTGSPENSAGITALLEEAYRIAHEAILEHSRKLPEGQIMGTTLSLLLFRGNSVYLAHVGDSRIYRLRGDHLEKLTKDHTEVQGLVDVGMIAEEDAENHRLSHVLTRVMGVRDRCRPDIRILDVTPSDRFLLSSDGLFRDLTLSAVEEIMAGDAPVPEKCALLIAQALDAGARDNVSVIVVEV